MYWLVLNKWERREVWEAELKESVLVIHYLIFKIAFCINTFKQICTRNHFFSSFILKFFKSLHLAQSTVLWALVELDLYYISLPRNGLAVTQVNASLSKNPV